jgi:FKBP12-rapamycin complex-associated protein
MTSPDAPNELILRLLNLCEFMEHEEKALPLENRLLGEYSAKTNAWAKALHYRELDFFQDPTLPVIEALIGINTKLQQSDAAYGALTTARDQYNMKGQEGWFEKLGRWTDAADHYDDELAKDPDNFSAVIGKMRCWHALGDFDLLSQDVEIYWQECTYDTQKELAPMAAAAAWCLNDWPNMRRFMDDMEDDMADKAFYQAIYQVHDNNFVKAALCIDRARDLLEPELTALVGEGYARSYKYICLFIVAESLLTSFQCHGSRPDAFRVGRDHTIPSEHGPAGAPGIDAQNLDEEVGLISSLFRHRLHADSHNRLVGCQPDVDVWQRVLQVRSLVLKPEDDSVMWIKFANLCRKNNRMTLADKTIHSLLPVDVRAGSSPYCM